MKRFGLLRRATIAIVAVIGIGAGSLVGNGAAWASADTSPPTLSSGSVNKKSFSLSDGPATFTVTVKASDPSGMETPVVNATSTTTSQSAGFGEMTLVAGTNTSGTWQRTISIPATAAPGFWDVTLFPLEDTLGNSGSFSTIATLTLNASAPADVSSPTFVSGSVDKKSFLLSDGPATFTVTVKASDPSGVDTPVVNATSTTTSQSAGFGEMTLVAGTNTSGTWQRIISIPATAAPGTWNVTLFPLEDTLGNSGSFITVTTITLTTKRALTASTPTVSGTPTVGVPLTATTGTWTTGTSFAYKWFANGTVQSGATSKSYTPTAANVGKKLTVQVTGSLTGYVTTSKTSRATAAVATGTLTTATPTLTGSAKVGSLLTTVTGKWSAGTVFSYEWAANGAVISGATKATYTPTAGQVGQKISVRVAGTLAGYTSQSKKSTETAAVAKGTLTSTTPTIAGTPKVGVALTAKTGSWTTGSTIAYQWLAGGKAITGATKSTFTPTTAQSGQKLTVQVIGTLAGYVSVSKKSAATAIVGP